jgi:hypothetical protein
MARERQQMRRAKPARDRTLQRSRKDDKSDRSEADRRARAATAEARRVVRAADRFLVEQSEHMSGGFGGLP